jgi:hypothetical protein
MPSPTRQMEISGIITKCLIARKFAKEWNILLLTLINRDINTYIHCPWKACKVTSSQKTVRTECPNLNSVSNRFFP